MAELMLVNPRRRRKSKAKAKRRVYTKRTKRRTKRNPVPVAANPRRRRRNPAKRGGNAMALLTTAFTQASGALALDLIIGNMPQNLMPANPMMRSIAKMGVGIGIGMIGARFLKGETSRNLALGALMVPIHETMRTIAQQTMPALKLGDAEGNAQMSMEGFGEYLPAGVSEYLPSMSGTDSNVDALANAAWNVDALAGMSGLSDIETPSQYEV